jgi:hypothetical protein
MRFSLSRISMICCFALMANTQDNRVRSLVISGHSHNDYLQTRPLWEAIENNFISIEADIHLQGQALLVGHDGKDLKANVTLQALYLDPLRSYIHDHNGWVYPGQELILLIDIKSPAEATYRALENELNNYSEMLTRYRSDSVEKGAVAVVISGNRPRDLMLNENWRCATYDGRLDDLDNTLPKNFITLISDNWDNYFSWGGKGPLPVDERAKLIQIIHKAHAMGYMIRFWNLPAGDPALRIKVWTGLLALGVDLINVDHLKAYHDFIYNSTDY